MACLITARDCKTAGETKAIGFDYEPFKINLWSQGTIYAVDEVVRPTEANGLEYKATAGQSGSCEPFWPKTVGLSVLDGSIIWTAQAMSEASLEAVIDTSTWSAETAITISDEETLNTDGQASTSCLVSGGVSGETYLITNSVLFVDGTIEESVLRLSVS